MKIYSLHDHNYIHDAPTVTAEDIDVEVTQPHLQHTDRYIHTEIQRTDRYIYTEIVLIVSNPTVHKICDTLDWLRKNEHENGDRRVKYHTYRARVNYTGRRTDEHKENARQEVIKEQRLKVPTRIEKTKAELIDYLNDRIKRTNRRYTDYAMNAIPSALRENINFENDSELEEPTKRLEEINEKIGDLKRQRKEVYARIAKIRNEVFVRDVDPPEIYPENVAPHIQIAVFSMAENNELFKPPNRSSFFG